MGVFTLEPAALLCAVHAGHAVPHPPHLAVVRAALLCILPNSPAVARAGCKWATGVVGAAVGLRTTWTLPQNGPQMDS